MIPAELNSISDEPAKVEYLASASRIAAGVKCADVCDNAVAEAGTPIRANSDLADFNSEVARGQFGSLGISAADMSTILRSCNARHLGILIEIGLPSALTSAL